MNNQDHKGSRFEEVMASIDGESYEKGQRFEKVLQWWLQNDPYWRTVLKPHSVKLWQDSELRDGVDIGIDLTAEGFDGSTWAIQAKNWKADNPIPKSEIDKFIVASNTSTYQQRVLVTSTNEISSNAERAISQQEKPLVVVKRDDLADSPIWDAFNLGQTNREPTPLKQLRPHQKAALSDVVKSFQSHDRGQLIMACGSGKTLTALRIGDRPHRIKVGPVGIEPTTHGLKERACRAILPSPPVNRQKSLENCLLFLGVLNRCYA